MNVGVKNRREAGWGGMRGRGRGGGNCEHGRGNINMDEWNVNSRRFMKTAVRQHGRQLKKRMGADERG